MDFPIPNLDQDWANSQNAHLIECAALGHLQACRILGGNLDHCYHCVKMAAVGWVDIQAMIKHGKIGVTMCGNECNCIFVTRWHVNPVVLSPAVERSIAFAKELLKAMDEEKH